MEQGSDLPLAKEKLRDAVRERFATLPRSELLAESRSLCRRIASLLPQTSVVCAYCPLRNEADILPLLRGLLKGGIPLFLPRVAEKRIIFHRVDDLQLLLPGEFGILEPPSSAPVLPSELATHVLIPGRAFDRSGGRLGRGNGGYDIWIRGQRLANPQTLFWGLSLEHQIVPVIPMEPHDERLDAIVTARGKIDCIVR